MYALQTGDEQNDGSPANDEISQRIPVIQEFLTVEKKIIETGKVIVNKSVEEEQFNYQIPWLEDEISLERIPINEYRDHAPVTRIEGDTTIVPVLKEVMVWQKKLLLVEEIRITKKVVTHEEQKTITLKKEVVEINRQTSEQK